MAEPERRRRRLRPPSGNAAPVPPPAVDETAGEAPPAPVDDTPAAAAETEPIADPAPEDESTAAPVPAAPTERLVRPPRNGNGNGNSRRPSSGPGDDREVERGLRGLVGSGSSQVSVGAALRARDAARPTDEQLAEADAHLVIVRRNWMPREELPRNR